MVGGERKPEEYAECVSSTVFSGPLLIISFRALKALPQAINSVLTPLAQYSGWKFTLLMGGPDPLQDGKIRVGRYVAYLVEILLF